ncbi:hypothetical protein [Haladaptatus sp. DYF46]|uniref:hypothetical protein n=1 Tax=Haladaptatus sp. DYF46 TaxID=2886041 RepID=UPI001E2DC505|nr:hypothetical protein [Haladaptatus sp. DYF46]
MVNDLTDEIPARRDSANVRREATDGIEGTPRESFERHSAGRRPSSVKPSRQRIADFTDGGFSP